MSVRWQPRDLLALEEQRAAPAPARMQPRNALRPRCALASCGQYLRSGDSFVSHATGREGGQGRRYHPGCFGEALLHV